MGLERRRVQLEGDSQSLLGRVSRELARVEKRDWELWSIALITGMVVATGLLVVIFPGAFMRSGDLHFEVSFPRELFLGLAALLVLFNTYLISKRLQLRKIREELISTTMQSELIRLQSLTDPLTEVYNRRSLEAMANRYINHARRLSKPLTFVMVDLDRFKDINTRFGHLTGDFVLSEVASLLKSVVRGSDAIVRFGGDEFLVILADTGIEGASIVTDRMTKCFDEWNASTPLVGHELSFAVGISEWKDGRGLDEILNHADQKMYSTKASRHSG
jgi:diguanylate cyclase (GGDEF)-like protein